MNRRNWFKAMGGLALASALPTYLRAQGATAETAKVVIRDFEQPMFNIPAQVSTPAIIESVELLKNGKNYFVRTRSTDGAVGLTGTKQINDFIPIFKNLVAPYFIGKDAREIESLVDGVYRANYKLAGIPFWSPVAYIEQSLLDMLGKMANKPVGEMLGGVWRDEIPVYLSGSPRDLRAEDEVEVYVRGIAETGTKAVKFKIGGRMSRNLDVYPGRTETLIKTARERLGDEVDLAVDANGSYDVAEGIRIGRLLEKYNFSFFEEPCPWENRTETQAVAKALNIPVSGGEQDSSLWQFQWLMDNKVVSIIQPDINYNGGLIRAKRVAKMAEELGINIVPHNTQTGANSVNILQFASCTKNALPRMEYPWRKPQETPEWYAPDFKITDGRIKVPKAAGMGIEFNPDFINKAEVLVRVDTPVSSGNVSGSGTSN
ncbi:MAG: mandelate racemase/muconate lactonizing enzyme family protein [Prevotellaceae bacterium]|jgi:L-alanine-DL-glutamate epimerase-like enolase superfamily enzyme|nr:mandelate racemase/muconate lactonizing enzyme family protein [Prevotellaceae bacterium]